MPTRAAEWTFTSIFPANLRIIVRSPSRSETIAAISRLGTTASIEFFTPMSGVRSGLSFNRSIPCRLSFGMFEFGRRFDTGRRRSKSPADRRRHPGIFRFRLRGRSTRGIFDGARRPPQRFQRRRERRLRDGERHRASRRGLHRRGRHAELGRRRRRREDLRDSHFRGTAVCRQQDLYSGTVGSGRRGDDRQPGNGDGHHQRRRHRRPVGPVVAVRGQLYRESKAGSITIAVHRTGGSSGAASVAYTTANRHGGCGLRFHGQLRYVDHGRTAMRGEIHSAWRVNKAKLFVGTKNFKFKLASPQAPRSARRWRPR